MTLNLGRMQTAMELARRLEEHPRIARVHYPGLPSHPDHDIAVDQMLGGFGGVISFEVGALTTIPVHSPICLGPMKRSSASGFATMTQEVLFKCHRCMKKSTIMLAIVLQCARISLKRTCWSTPHASWKLS